MYCLRTTRLFGALLVAGIAAPEVAVQYFPDQAFAAKTADNTFFSDWYSGLLSGLREPPLYGQPRSSGLESYRFLWVRSFHSPIAIRLDISDGSRPATLTVKRGSLGQDYRKTHLLNTSTTAVTKEQVQGFRDQVTRAGFWDVDSFAGVTGTGADGSEWIIEGSRGREYHVVSRWSPQDGPIRTLGLALVQEIARMKLSPAEIY